MKLADLANRRVPPEPWIEGALPWDDPDFSVRMLREHLTQKHDRASRRSEHIDAQVAWLHAEVLDSTPSRVLDLGCGPGLYTQRLAARGHTCVGIDFSPASIDHARNQAGELSCHYVHGDIRTAHYGENHDLCTLLFGELNGFPRADAERILHRAHAALAPGGRLVVEAHTFDAVRAKATPPSWYSADGGLFSDGAHVVLKEGFWSEAHAAATERYYVIDPATAEVTPYALSSQAYTEEEYIELFTACGFPEPDIRPGLGEVQEGLIAIVARRQDS